MKQVQSIKVNAFIGVPWKGRNFKKAAKEALEESFYDPEFLADRFNGVSKQEAKSESISQGFLNEVNQSGWQEAGRFVDTGRKSPRFGFDQVETEEGLVKGYRNGTFESGFDEVYAPDDLTVSEVLDGETSLEEYESGDFESIYLGDNAYSGRQKIDLEAILDSHVDDYRVEETVDAGVSLAPMVSDDLEEGDRIETVLVSQDLEDISRSLTNYIWGDAECMTFQEFAEREETSYSDEEELIGYRPEVAGVYIVDSGTTADENSLNYERTADSYLRRWTAKPENSFKELEETTA